MRKEPNAAALQRARKPQKIFHRVKARLIGKAQGGPALQKGARVIARPFHAQKADALAGRALLRQNLGVVALAQKQITVEPGEIAGDALVHLDRRDALDRSLLAFAENARLRLAAHANIILIKIVAGAGEMGGRARAHAPGERPAIEDDDVLPGEAQFISRRQARDAGADHDDVACEAGVERGPAARRRPRHPERLRGFGTDVHDRPSRCVGGNQPEAKRDGSRP